MIARIWRGSTRPGHADEYLAYLHRTGIPDYRATDGNRGVYVLRRVADDRAEFVLISLWESMDAIRAFAGDRPERARYYPEDDKYLVEKVPTVDHYDIVVEG